jgi:predicted nucleotidyltransferase
VVKAYLFGSWAKGTEHAWSDIDVCLFIETNSAKLNNDFIVNYVLSGIIIFC